MIETIIKRYDKSKVIDMEEKIIMNLLALL